MALDSVLPAASSGANLTADRAGRLCTGRESLFHDFVCCSGAASNFLLQPGEQK